MDAATMHAWEKGCGVITKLGVCREVVAPRAHGSADDTQQADDLEPSPHRPPHFQSLRCACLLVRIITFSQSDRQTGKIYYRHH